MDRVPSADDLMSALMWRTAHHAREGNPSHAPGGLAGFAGVARTPSQNEMESYYAAMMANAAAGGSSGALGEQFLAGLGGPGSAPNSREGTPGIPRVASIDVLRKMIMGGGYGSGAQGGGSTSPGSMTPTTAAAFSAFASGANLSALGQLGAAAAEAVAAAGGEMDAGRGSKRGAKKTAVKAPPAKKGKTAAASKGGAKGKAAAESAAAQARSKSTKTSELSEDHDSDGQSREDGDGSNDVRRQRRMLSNRESARRSRRRKLEHVAALENQIAGLNAQYVAALNQARNLEARNAELVRENAAIRAERDRLLQILREQGPPGGSVTAPKTGTAMERKSSLQRISSSGDIKGELGKGSPTIGSGSGFVPFRSLQSYENLLALQEAKADK